MKRQRSFLASTLIDLGSLCLLALGIWALARLSTYFGLP